MERDEREYVDNGNRMAVSQIGFLLTMQKRVVGVLVKATGPGVLFVGSFHSSLLLKLQVDCLANVVGIAGDIEGAERYRDPNAGRGRT